MFFCYLEKKRWRAVVFNYLMVLYNIKTRVMNCILIFIKIFKKELLFEKQPYVAHLENPAKNDVVKGGKVDSSALQKFLLVTDLLQDSIQENLDMIVTDGSFNSASIR